MGDTTRSFSTVLPGAWSSSWTLSPQQNIKETPKLPPPMPYSGSVHQHEKLCISPTVSLFSKSLGVDAAADEGSMHMDADAGGTSFADDDSSAFSEDFYSIISHDDTDTTLFPSVASISPAKELGSSDGILDPLDLSGSNFDSSELYSSLHLSVHEDVLVSDVLPSARETSVSAYVYPSIDNMSLVLADDIRLTSPLGFSLPNISACGQPLTVGALSIDAVTHISSDSLVDPSGYECDSASAHSDYSDINFNGISNLITRLDAGNGSRASDVSWSRSSSQEDTGRSIYEHIDSHPPLNSQPSTLLLSQPDGDCPWTLFLDPTLTSTESEAVSRSSTSLSLNSSFSLEGDRVSTTSRHTITSNVSLRSPFTPYSEPHSATSPLSEQCSHFPVYGRHIATESTPSNPGPSLSTINQNDSPRSKNFMQKTKNICSKLKSFITLKAKKERNPKETKDSYTSSIRRTPIINPPEPRLSPTLHPFPQMAAESFSSVDRRYPSQRTAKMSAPSVALSYTPEYTVGRSTQTSDERLTYEYHARPKTLKEIKSKRRFSLPAFSRGPSSGPSTRNPGLSPVMHGQVGSNLTIEGRTR